MKPDSADALEASGSARHAEDVVPVVLFTFARPDHLRRTLSCLHENQVPLIFAFSDGPKSAADAASVAAVRAQLRAIDWADVRITERPANLGLGANVLAGVSEVAATHDAFVVWEDDLICTPGTYAWLVAALRHYADDRRVMSVTGWTHPRVTPADLRNQPYFDRRAECWVWGAWARSWRGMANEPAMAKMAAAMARGVPPDAYGTDLPVMARAEAARNIWAVRWLYHHFQHDGLCLRPPWSMVEHIGFGADATNAVNAGAWANPPLRPAPPIPERWPAAGEHAACRGLWRDAARAPSLWFRVAARARSFFRRRK